MDINISSFKQFVFDQPADAVINNSSWNSCAVGAYAREVHGHRIISPDDEGFTYAAVKEDIVVRGLYCDCGSTDDASMANHYGIALSNDPSLMDLLNCGVFDTYGGLQGWFNGTYHPID